MFDEQTIFNQNSFVSSVLALAARFQFSVTSWGRTKAHNAAVGGVSDSQHLVWTAVDLVLDPGVNRLAFMDSARNEGLFAIDETTHIHLQLSR